jgi:GMP synthase (glutamine-hydrolysing)
MKALIIKHVSTEDLGTIESVLRAKDFSIDRIEIEKGDPLPDSVSEYDALFIMGGPMAAYDRDKYPVFDKEVVLVLEAAEQRKLVVGVCLGAQIIAGIYGGNVYPNEHKEIGWHPVNFFGEPANQFGIGGHQIPLFHWHSDTFDPPHGAEIFAKSDLTKNQAFVIGKNIYGLQFHLEVTGKMVQEWITAYDVQLAKDQINTKKILSDTKRYVKDLETLCKNIFTTILDTSL